METIETNTTKSTYFVKYLFNFDAETKGDIMNLIQYSLLAITPIIILNKLIQNYVPHADDSKGSLEIVAEVVMQLSVLLSGMFFINRIVTYVPMYSGKDLGNVNLINMILGFLIIVLGLQTKLGEKVEILTTRVVDLWGGNTEEVEVKSKNIVKVKQPISGSTPTHQPSQADNLARNMDVAPQYNVRQPLPPTQQPLPPTQPTQQVKSPGLSSQTYANSLQSQNVDSMYQEPMEPMAANDGFGAFASW